MLELTDVLASLVEQYGVRGVLGLRTALQQLCKASLDGMHAKALGKLTSKQLVVDVGRGCWGRREGCWCRRGVG